jgi:hypothetical protein
MNFSVTALAGSISAELVDAPPRMLDKKIAMIVALTLLSATIVLGETSNVIVNGSGIVANTQPAIETELIIGHSGSPANILVITQANQYLFRGTVNSITETDGSTYVKLLVTNSTGTEFTANASTINLNTWKLEIVGKPVYVMTGHLQISPV